MTRVLHAATLAVVAVLLVASGQAATGSPDADAAHARFLRLQERLEAAAQLSAPQRAQMRVNLDACRSLDVPPAEIDALFPGHPGGDFEPATALRLQSVVLRAARGALPLDPVLAKVREGHMKHAPDEVLVQAGEQIVDDMGAARALLDAGADAGLTPPQDAAQRQAQIRTLSRAMWRGLSEDDAEQLRQRAQERLGAGPCATGDLAAAGEVTVRIREQGGDSDGALRLVGAALVHGYTASDLVELGRLLAGQRLAGADVAALVADLTDQVDQGLAAGALNRYLQQPAWMGPADAPGPGGGPGSPAGDAPGPGGPGSAGPGSGSGSDQGGAGGGSGAGGSGGPVGGGS